MLENRKRKLGRTRAVPLLPRTPAGVMLERETHHFLQHFSTVALPSLGGDGLILRRRGGVEITRQMIQHEVKCEAFLFAGPHALIRSLRK